MAETEVPLHVRPAQVEVAVLEAELLARLGGIGHRERRDLGNGEDLEPGSFDFDVVRRKIGPGSGHLAAPDEPADGDDEFRAELLRLFDEGGVFGPEDDLDAALPVAQVDEDEMAHVAGFLDPAAESDLRAGVGGAERAGVTRPFPGFGGRGGRGVHQVVPSFKPDRRESAGGGRGSRRGSLRSGSRRPCP